MCHGTPQPQPPAGVGGERELVSRCVEPYQKHPCQGLGVGETQEHVGGWFSCPGAEVLGPRMYEERGAKR